ncbi:hypothetical protein LguiA_018471 [Lonicera macranthoides]
MLLLLGFNNLIGKLNPCYSVNRIRKKRNEKKGSTLARVVRNENEINFNDSDWKKHFQHDFESRFNLLHLRDVVDIRPRPTTFSLRNRGSRVMVATDGLEDQKDGYVNDNDRALLKVIKYASPTSAGAECIDPECSWVEQWVHRAGPRRHIYFDLAEVKAGIVTCGGLCPGLNDVIRQIVFSLELNGVKNIVGIQHGYRGFFEEGVPKIKLSRQVVQNINLAGGSLLGVSRGGANAIHEEELVFFCYQRVSTRKKKVSVVCVPKTIDNDILLMDKTFGFDTAVEEAQRAINSAYIEVPFSLDGTYGVLQHIEHLIQTKGSAVICLAEGAGQDLLEKSNLKDASGNVIFADFGVHFQQQIKRHFKEINVPADLKYIDPTYMIRACRANASDAKLCTVLGQNAVHGAFAGYSGITVGICNTHYVYLPIPEVIASPRYVDPNSRMWHRCLTSTGQPDFC